MMKINGTFNPALTLPEAQFSQRLMTGPLPRTHCFAANGDEFVNGGQVFGLRIVSAEEAETLGEKRFLLGFDPKDGAFHLDRENIRAHPALKKALLF
jgi:hypothetical protein